MLSIPPAQRLKRLRLITICVVTVFFACFYGQNRYREYQLSRGELAEGKITAFARTLGRRPPGWRGWLAKKPVTVLKVSYTFLDKDGISWDGEQSMDQAAYTALLEHSNLLRIRYLRPDPKTSRIEMS